MMRLRPAPVSASTEFGTARLYWGNLGPGHAGQPRAIVVPGFSENLSHTKPIIDALAERGISAISFTPPRSKSKEYPVGFIDPIERQGRVVRSIKEYFYYGKERVHGLAHSLGAAALLKAAIETPDTFGKLVLMQPIGFGEEQDFSTLAKRAARKVLNNHEAALQGPQSVRDTFRVLAAQASSAQVLVRQPGLARREAISAGTYSIEEDLVRAQDLGIPIHIFMVEGDEFYDEGVISKAQQDVGHLVTSFTVLPETDFGHDIFWADPTYTADLTAEIIYSDSDL